MILILFQGYILGNAATEPTVEENSKIPFAHGMGLISNELYEVTQSSISVPQLNVISEKREEAKYEITRIWECN